MADDATPHTTTAVAVRAPRQFATVEAPIGIMATDTFEHMGRVAKVLALANLLPMSLTHHKPEGARDLIALPFDVVQARAFLVVSQAHLWNADPIAIAQCTSLVHGKLCYEGKLIAALIEAKAGITLKYEFGRFDVNKGDIILGPEVKIDDRALGVRVSNKDDPEDFIAGSVEMWHTGDKGPWQKALNWRRQLRYRGAREWARAYKPHLILGILTDDEVEDFQEMALVRAEERSKRGQKQDIRGKLAGPKAGDEGFSAEHVAGETAGRVIEAEAVVVETELKVGGEPDPEAPAEVVETAAAPEAAKEEKPARKTRARPAPAAPEPPTADEEEEPEDPAEPEVDEAEADPIGDFIDSLEGLDMWLEQIKPAWYGFKKSDAYKNAGEARRIEANIAVVERVWEVTADIGGMKPHQDPTFFTAWVILMMEKGARPEGARAIAKELDLLRQTDAFKAISDGGRKAIEDYTAHVIGKVGEGII